MSAEAGRLDLDDIVAGAQIDGIENAPAVSVTTVATTAWRGVNSVTVAPATAPPDPSFTVPVNASASASTGRTMKSPRQAFGRAA